MLALGDLREVPDVFGATARSLARDLRRRCVAYELRGAAFVAVYASDGGVERTAYRPRDVDLGELRLRRVVRRGTDDVVALAADGAVRGLLVLEDARDALSVSDEAHVRAVSAHASLALANAFAFEQLRRYAAEGAALGEAAKTFLTFTELEPLAESLCAVAVRLVRGEWVAMYVGRNGRLERIANASERGAGGPLDLPAEPPSAQGAGEPPVLLPLGRPPAARPRLASAEVRSLSDSESAADGSRMLAASRREPFEKADLRLLDALATLGGLALNNVDAHVQTARANEALAESNAFKDDLMAMFAHDFRGPLTVISGYSELLLDCADPAVRRSARTIAEQTRRLAHLSDDALALAATQSAGFSLQRELEEVTRFVRATAESLDPTGGRIAVDAPAEPVLAPFDRSRLRHAVENVLGNALKFSTGQVRVRVASDARSVRIDVADEGIGIPRADLERIFTRFGRAANAGSRGIPGSGVGLYIAKKIVEIHGGRLEVASVENQGSTFSVILSL